MGASTSRDYGSCTEGCPIKGEQPPDLVVMVATEKGPADGFLVRATDSRNIPQDLPARGGIAAFRNLRAGSATVEVVLNEEQAKTFLPLPKFDVAIVKGNTAKPPLLLLANKYWFVPIENDIGDLEDPEVRKKPYWMPPPRGGNDVKYLIDGPETYQNMLDDLFTASGPDKDHRGHFIYLAGWWVNYDFGLDHPGGTTLKDVLKNADKSNCMIRALFWNRTTGQYLHQNEKEVAFINSLSNGHAILDGRHHVRGTHHQKIVCIYGSEGLICYCGGVDFNYDRVYEIGETIPGIEDSSDAMNCNRAHPVLPRGQYWSDGSPILDVHCRIRGPAAYDVLEIFLKRYADWPQSLERTRKVASRVGEILVPPRPTPLPGSTVYLRTTATFGNQPNDIDARKFTVSDETLRALEQGAPKGTTSITIQGTLKDPDREIDPETQHGDPWPYAFAPNGRQSARAQLLWAINSARDYIYFEDQYMVSEEIAKKLNKALQRGVQFVLGVIPHQIISTDFDNAIGCEPLSRVRRTFFIDNVIRGIPDWRDRFLLFYPKREPRYQGSVYQYIHSKVWVFDDKFCTIGSMNINNRGTTHDSELAVGIYEPLDSSSKPGFARRLRKRLWARLLRKRKTGSEEETPEESLEYWEGKVADPMKGLDLWKEVAGDGDWKEGTWKDFVARYDWTGPAFNPGVANQNLEKHNTLVDPRIDLSALSIKVENPSVSEPEMVILDVEKKRLDLKGQILFAFDKWSIKGKDSFSLLDKIAEKLKEHPEVVKVKIDGHTDNAGDATYNLKLSQKRAEEVVNYLTTKKGIEAGRLVAKGFGASSPVGDNRTNEGRKANRRVEFNLEMSP